MLLTPWNEMKLLHVHFDNAFFWETKQINYKETNNQVLQITVPVRSGEQLFIQIQVLHALSHHEQRLFYW